MQNVIASVLILKEYYTNVKAKLHASFCNDFGEDLNYQIRILSYSQNIIVSTFYGNCTTYLTFYRRCFVFHVSFIYQHLMDAVCKLIKCNSNSVVFRPFLHNTLRESLTVFFFCKTSK